MNRKRLIGALAAMLAIAYLSVAAAAWDRYVVDRSPVRARLSRLVVTTPPPGYTTKPSSARVVTAASNPFAAYKSAAGSSPAGTGSFATSWSNPKKSGDSATVLISYLPSGSAAARVQAQAATQYEAADSFKSGGYASAGPVTVPGVPGAKGAVFEATSGTSAPVSAVAFTTGRVQVLVILTQAGAPAAAGQAASALSVREYQHLRSSLPGFDLVRTSVPLVPTVIYWGIVAGLLLLAVGTPLAVRRSRRRRAEARRRAVRSQHQVRGSKIARRQASRRPPAPRR